jgi:tRNA threonylcarbamoyladenosine biosynthesis protein TsaB
VVLDARRGDIFGAVYDERSHLVTEETVTKLPLWLESLPKGDYEFISGSDIAGTDGFLRAPHYLGEAVAICAERDGKDGKWSDPAALDANYVRRSDAELFWKDS